MILTHTHVMPPLGISVLRCVRLLRVFKVTKYVIHLKKNLSSTTLFFLQILAIAVEFSRLVVKLNTINSVSITFAVLVYCYFCFTRHASFWWKI